MSLKGNKAQVADIQRAFQRDGTFLDGIQEDFGALLKLLGNSTYNSHRKFIPAIATSWYYFTTSLSNRQTLGEEYAGILRIVGENQLPGKLVKVAPIGGRLTLICFFSCSMFGCCCLFAERIFMIGC